MFHCAAEGFSLWVLNLPGLRLARNIFDRKICDMFYKGLNFVSAHRPCSTVGALRFALHKGSSCRFNSVARAGC